MKKNLAAPIGIILLVAGIAVLGYGVYEFNAARQSLGNAIGKMFTGKSNVETRAVIIMIGGGAAAVIGAILALGRRR